MYRAFNVGLVVGLAMSAGVAIIALTIHARLENEEVKQIIESACGVCETPGALCGKLTCTQDGWK